MVKVLSTEVRDLHASTLKGRRIRTNIYLTWRIPRGCQIIVLNGVALEDKDVFLTALRYYDPSRTGSLCLSLVILSGPVVVRANRERLNHRKSTKCYY